jgi:glycosyltransferase involved in cell wall biosynthesis
LRYAVITPARDEATSLPRLAVALAAQTLAPTTWVVVDDGSADGSAALLASLAREHPWIRPWAWTGGDGTHLNAGRREGRALEAFRAGLAALDAPVDVVIKVDADVDFEPTYCEQLVRRFDSDPALGIASGTCLELEGERWVRRSKAETTVWGASRAYRWECLPDVLALAPRMGWDGLDELSVQRRGYRTEAFTDLPFRHHRAEGARERSGLHHGDAQGRAAWYMGYRPSYLVLRALYRARRQPTALAMLWGYTAAALRREPRCEDEGIRATLRSRQRLRTALRRGAPAS